MISLINVTKKFGDKVIIANINMEFEKGKIYGIIGKNGAGKTVLFKLMCGLMPATTGDVIVNGKTIGKDLDFPANCGIIIENPGFINGLSGYKNLKLLSQIRGKTSDDTIKEYMSYFDLDCGDTRSVKKYSLGMKQKLGIIQAVMEDQEILILDEPMNSLDEGSANRVRELLAKIKDDKLIILASHHREDLETLCDEIYLIESSSVIRKTQDTLMHMVQ